MSLTEEMYMIEDVIFILNRLEEWECSDNVWESIQDSIADLKLVNCSLFVKDNQRGGKNV